MSKYECPYCHQKTFSHLKKAFMGGPASKGKPCPNCQNHCVNGMKTNIINSVIMMIALIAAFYIRYGGSADVVLMAEIIAVAFILTKIVNAFIGKVEKNNRLDL